VQDVPISVQLQSAEKADVTFYHDKSRTNVVIGSSNAKHCITISEQFMASEVKQQTIVFQLYFIL
jgi:hypothetical protein